MVGMLASTVVRREQCWHLHREGMKIPMHVYYNIDEFVGKGLQACEYTTKSCE